MSILVSEIWRDIEGFDGYQVSNYGRVRTFNKVTSNARYATRHWRNRIIKQKVRKDNFFALHCTEIEVVHPYSNKKILVKSEVPFYFNEK